MKKLLLSLLVISMQVGISKAQSIQIFKTGSVVDAINDTIDFTHYVDTNAFAIDLSHSSFVNIVNNTSSTMTIGLRRIERQIIPGTSDYLCWGATCFGSYPAGDTVSWIVDDVAVVAPNDTAGGFGLVVYIQPNKKSGTAIYEYEFYDRNSPLTTSSVFVRWNIFYKEDNIQIEGANNTKLAGDTLTITDTLFGGNSNPSLFSRVSIAELINNSVSDKTINISRREISAINGTEDSLCWNTTHCLPFAASGTNVTRSLQSVDRLAPGDTSDGPGLSFYLKHNNKVGTAIYEISFIDSAVTTNSISFIVKWVILNATALEENARESVDFSLFPNPAKNSVNVLLDNKSASLNQEIQLIDMLGKVVLRRTVNSAQENIFLDVSKLSGGVYFVSNVVDGERLSTKKLIVR